MKMTEEQFSEVLALLLEADDEDREELWQLLKIAELLREEAWRRGERERPASPI